jgi:hypothetical protein
MKRGIVLIGVLALLGVAAAAYLRVGWTRMENACTADRPRGAGTGSTSFKAFRNPSQDAVTFGYSLHPLGFQCTYEDGRQRTSLWF